eukprot:762708-Hanusia_phi.AAC.1
MGFISYTCQSSTYCEAPGRTHHTRVSARGILPRRMSSSSIIKTRLHRVESACTFTGEVKRVHTFSSSNHQGRWRAFCLGLDVPGHCGGEYFTYLATAAAAELVLHIAVSLCASLRPSRADLDPVGPGLRPSGTLTRLARG